MQPCECVEAGAPGACMTVIECPSLLHVPSLASALSGAAAPPPPKGSAGAAGGQLKCIFIVHMAPMEALLDEVCG